MVENIITKKTAGSIGINERSDMNDPLVFEDPKINIKLKLSALWATVMFLYIYVDIVGFFKPGVVSDILAGKVWTMDITQAWAIVALVLMIIPSLMVFISMALPARVNRKTNMIAGIAYIFVGFGTMVGETWFFYIIGHLTAIGLLVLITWSAWNWPKREN